MAFQTGANFATYVKSIFKRTDKDTELFEATTDISMDVRLRLYSQDWAEEAYTTGISTSGDYKLGLPSDFGHMLGTITLIDPTTTEYAPLRKVSKETYDEMTTDRLLAAASQSQGVPKWFCIYAEQIHLSPVPDSTTYQYNFNYTTEDATAIVTGTTEVPFTDRYRYMMRAGVLSILYFLVNNDEQGVKWQSIYERELAKVKAKYDRDIAVSEPIQYSGV